MSPQASQNNVKENTFNSEFGKVSMTRLLIMRNDLILGSGQGIRTDMVIRAKGIGAVRTRV
uniref:Uncharacterized protein n=1 Tax=Moniliophthora roreri TaxID=221103 RepID=A0A0W0FTR0_MONRR